MVDRLRIAQAVHWFLPRHRSGTEQHVYSLATELGRRHEVAVFCGEDDPTVQPRAEEAWPRFRVRRVHVSPDATAPLLERARGRFQSRAAEQAFERFLSSFQPDLVHVHHLFKLSGGLIACARRRGIPVVVTLHDYWFICDNAQLLYGGQVPCTGPGMGWRCARCMSSELDGSWGRALAPLGGPLYVYRTLYLRRALQGADEVVSPSAYVCERLERAGLRLVRSRVLQHGTDDSWLGGYRRTPGQGRLRVGYLGTVAAHKGVEHLLRAFLALPEGQAELHIHGDAPGRPEYLAALRKLAGGSPVYFHGAYQRPALGEILGHLDLVVVPSIWPENAPLIVQEALLARVPVLAADIGALREFVTPEENGLLFRAGDVGALEAALRRVLAEPELVARWSQAIRPPKTMAEYAREMEDIYAQVLAERARGEGACSHLGAML